MEFDDVALYACEYLLKAYPERMVERYKLPELPSSDIELLEEIGRLRGCRRPGGRIDLHKASEILLNELRAGTLGLLTLETPDMVEAEEVKVAELIAKKEAVKEAKAAKRKKRKR